MEKGIDIHNYDRLLAKTMVRMKSSGISEKNKNAIEKFGDHCFANGIGKDKGDKNPQKINTLTFIVKEN
ncbi:hypothetical protein HYX09_01250 [Candidatus Woesearchaeota archaeon]|nr:hypothetical protein [Candidatus Woesearchaeota archaeon]MBI2660874.1 hypothetical protein [Candidatus Woesearchaeota archaeon]